MDCPEHLAFKVGRLYVWMYYVDIPKHLVPIRIWLNPLRYEIAMYTKYIKFRINREGIWNRKFSNLIYKIKRYHNGS
jgi:hypothetical protein